MITLFDLLLDRELPDSPKATVHTRLPSGGITLIYGDAMSGKTHLVREIANSYLLRNESVVFLSRDGDARIPPMMQRLPNLRVIPPAHTTEAVYTALQVAGEAPPPPLIILDGHFGFDTGLNDSNIRTLKREVFGKPTTLVVTTNGIPTSARDTTLLLECDVAICLSRTGTYEIEKQKEHLLPPSGSVSQLLELLK